MHRREGMSGAGAPLRAGNVGLSRTPRGPSPSVSQSLALSPGLGGAPWATQQKPRVGLSRPRKPAATAPTPPSQTTALLTSPPPTAAAALQAPKPTPLSASSSPPIAHTTTTATSSSSNISGRRRWVSPRTADDAKENAHPNQASSACPPHSAAKASATTEKQFATPSPSPPKRSRRSATSMKKGASVPAAPTLQPATLATPTPAPAHSDIVAPIPPSPEVISIHSTPVDSCGPSQAQTPQYTPGTLCSPADADVHIPPTPPSLSPTIGGVVVIVPDTPAVEPVTPTPAPAPAASSSAVFATAATATATAAAPCTPGLDRSLLIPETPPIGRRSDLRDHDLCVIPETPSGAGISSCFTTPAAAAAAAAASPMFVTPATSRRRARISASAVVVSPAAAASAAASPASTGFNLPPPPTPAVAAAADPVETVVAATAAAAAPAFGTGGVAAPSSAVSIVAAAPIPAPIPAPMLAPASMATAAADSAPHAAVQAAARPSAPVHMHRRRRGAPRAQSQAPLPLPLPLPFSPEQGSPLSPPLSDHCTPPQPAQQKHKTEDASAAAHGHRHSTKREADSKPLPLPLPLPLFSSLDPHDFSASEAQEALRHMDEFDNKPGDNCFGEPGPVCCAPRPTTTATTTATAATATTMAGALVKQGSVAGATAVAAPHTASADIKPALQPQPLPAAALSPLAPTSAHAPMHSPPDSQRECDDWAGYCSESGVDESFELTCAEFVAPDLLAANAPLSSSSSSFGSVAAAAAAVAPPPPLSLKNENNAVAGEVDAATPAQPVPAAPCTPPSSRSRSLGGAPPSPSLGSPSAVSPSKARRHPATSLDTRRVYLTRLRRALAATDPPGFDRARVLDHRMEVRVREGSVAPYVEAAQQALYALECCEGVAQQFMVSVAVDEFLDMHVPAAALPAPPAPAVVGTSQGAAAAVSTSPHTRAPVASVSASNRVASPARPTVIPIAPASPARAPAPTTGFSSTAALAPAPQSTTPHVAAPRTGKFFKKVPKATAAAAVAAITGAAPFAHAAPAAPSSSSAATPTAAVAATVIAHAPAPAPSRRSGGSGGGDIRSFTSPAAKSVTEQLLEQSRREAEGRAAKMLADADRALKELQAATAATGVTVTFAPGAVAAVSVAPAAAVVPTVATATAPSSASTPTVARAVYSIFNKRTPTPNSASSSSTTASTPGPSSANTSAMSSGAGPRTPQQQAVAARLSTDVEAAMQPWALPAHMAAAHPRLPGSAVAAAAAAALLTPSKEYPNRQLHFATPEHATVTPGAQQRGSKRFSGGQGLPQLSEVSEGKEDPPLTPEDHMHFRPLPPPGDGEGATAAAVRPPSALPVLSDPPPLERPSPFPAEALEAAGGEGAGAGAAVVPGGVDGHGHGHGCASPAHSESQHASSSFLSQMEEEDSFARFMRVKQEPLPPLPPPQQQPQALAQALHPEETNPATVALVQTRKRPHPSTPPPPFHSAAVVAAAPAAAIETASPSRALQSIPAHVPTSSPLPGSVAHTSPVAPMHRSAQDFLSPPGRALAVSGSGGGGGFVTPATPVVYTSPLTSSAPSSSSSSSSGLHTPSPAQRQRPRQHRVPSPQGDAGAAAADEDEAQVVRQVFDVDAPAASSVASMNKDKHKGKKRRRTSTGSGSKDAAGTHKKSKPSMDSAAGTGTASADAPPAAQAQPSALLAGPNPHKQLARRLNQRQSVSRSSGAGRKRNPQRGQWGTSAADGRHYYVSLADGMEYSGAEAVARAQADQESLQRRRGLKFQQQPATAAAPATPIPAAAAATSAASTSSPIDLTTSLSPSHSSPAGSARSPLAQSPLHLLDAWFVPKCIVDAYAEAGLRTLYDWQVECLSQPGVLDGSQNLVYSASTSAGKTLVAEILMLNRMLLLSPAAQAATGAAAAATGLGGSAGACANRKVLFVLPYVSIVDEKCADLARKLAHAGFCVKAYHGQQSAAQLDSNGAGGANASASMRDMNRLSSEIDVAVVVIEKANVLLASLQREQRMGELCAVVIDELHMISSGMGGVDATSGSHRGFSQNSFANNRGYHLELLLTKVRQWNASRAAAAATAVAGGDGSVPCALPIQIIGLSATLPNMDLFASWLRPCQVYTTEFRPVPLREYVLYGRTLYLKVPNPDFDAAPQVQGAVSTSAAAAAPARTALQRYSFVEARTMHPSLIGAQVRHRRSELDQMSQAAIGDGGGGGGNHPRSRAGAASASSSSSMSREEEEELELMLDLVEEITVPSSRLGGGIGGGVGAGGVLIFCPSKMAVEKYATRLAKGLRRRAHIRSSGYVETRARHASASKQRTLDSMFDSPAMHSKNTSPATGAASNSSSSSKSPASPAGAGPSAADLQQRRSLLLQQLAGASDCLDKSLERSIPSGVGFHHAGLTGDERALVEQAFRCGTLSVLTCTSTLAAGVNLPARRVLFQGIRVGPNQLTVTQYQQMSGRAGRAGMAHEEGSSVIIVRKQHEFDNIRSIINQQLPQLKSALDVDCSNMDCPALLPPAPSVSAPSVSVSMGPPQPAPRPANPFLAHGLLECMSTSAALSGGITAAPMSRDTIEAFLGHTLLAHQKAAEDAARNRGAMQRAEVRASIRPGQAHAPNTAALSSLSPSLQRELELSLSFLASRNLIEAPRGSSDGSLVGRATDLGCALVEAGLNPRDGLRLYHELVHVRTGGLVLSSPLHLCWLLTPEATGFVSHDVQLEHDKWEAMRRRWMQLHECKEDLAVCDRIPLPLSLRQQRQQQQQQHQPHQPPPIRLVPFAPRAPAVTAPINNANPFIRGAPSSTTAAPTAPVAAQSIADASFVERTAQLFHSWVAQDDRPSMLCPLLRAYLRFHNALLLHDLLNERVPLSSLSAATGLARGDLQRKLTEACTLCNQLIALCERLGWRDLALVLAHLRERLAHQGAPADLLALMRIPGLKLGRARLLHAAGYDTVDKIAMHASARKLFDIFAAANAYRPAATRRGGAHGFGGVAGVAPSTPAPDAHEARTRALDMQQAVEIFHSARKLLKMARNT